MPWMIVVLVLMIPILAIVLDSPLGQALAARLKPGRLERSSEDVDRVGYLEGEVERLGAEVQRLDEESQFLHKLLTDREPGGALPPGDGNGAD